MRTRARRAPLLCLLGLHRDRPIVNALFERGSKWERCGRVPVREYDSAKSPKAAALTARGVRLLLAAGLCAAAGCGADDDAAEPRVVVDDPGVAHIHGVGVDPADDSLVIATHTGMFRVATGERAPKRIGDRRQDTMGFTVVGPKRFIGSGHPDARDDLPALLGLIRTDDAGMSWDSVSLLGEADFHVLRAAGSRIYGVNATDGKLYVSDDGGRRWATRVPPGDVVDVAPRLGRPDELVASAVDGLYVSRDAGERWRPLDPGRIGLLTWTSASDLFLVDAGGAVHRSADGGRAWKEVGSVGGRPAAFAAHEDELYVALHTNEVKLSADGGRTWTVRARG